MPDKNGWYEYSAEAFAQARGEQKVVVVDFTAEWDINNKLLRVTVLEKEPVKSALQQPHVVKLSANLTADGAVGWKKLEELGENGIPLLTIYSSGEEKPWKSNAYQAEDVLKALEAAGQAVASAR
jgi:thiol:disulfide interchange protein